MKNRITVSRYASRLEFSLCAESPLTLSEQEDDVLKIVFSVPPNTLAGERKGACSYADGSK